MNRCLRFFLALSAIILSTACTPQSETGIEGRLLVGDRPLAGAQVEIYLKSDKDRSTAPFAATTTDGEGGYRLDLPPGRYFLIGKKRETTADGRDRMLMAECPANPVEVSSGRLQVAPLALAEMGHGRALIPDPGTGVSGRVTTDGDPVAGAYVYVYTDERAGLMGPSYGEAAQTGDDGRYHIELPAGRYFLAARKRFGGGRLGEPAPGDLNGVHPANPVMLARGQTLEVVDLPLTPVDAEMHRERRAQGKFTATETVVVGRAVDTDGMPARGIYFFAYSDGRMIGKPGFISAATGDDGRFTLYLGDGGTWYLGARSAFGGPLEPGERVGTYDGRADHGVVVARGESRDLGDIPVREVW